MFPLCSRSFAKSSVSLSFFNGRKKKRQMVCKPGFVEDGHSSGTSVAGCLARPTRATARKKRLPACRRLAAPIWSCSRWGLPCRPCCQGRGALLPHPFTLTGLIARNRRFAFCGTFPGVAPAGRYPAPSFRGARTFLPRREPSGSGHPTI